MDGVITNKFIFQSPKIDDIRNVVKDHIKNHHYRFIQFNIKCSWELCFFRQLNPFSYLKYYKFFQ